MKIDRLISITNYLLHYGKTSAQKLSEKFEVSTRTIMRDIDTLGQAGIPIQSEYGADGGYKIIDTYVVDKKIINSQDYDYIIVALKGLLSAHSNKNIEQTIDKIIPFYDNKNNMINLDFGIANEKDEINQNISLLEDAIKRKRVVEFTYTNNENLMKQVQVEPISKEYMNGDFDFCFSVPEDENYWFGVVLSFGNNVRVLEPQSVIDRILKNCSEVSKIYEHDN